MQRGFNAKPDDAARRADAHFKAREILKADAGRATEDYRAALAAIVERTRELRAQRLAREASVVQAAARTAQVAARKGRRRAS